MTLFSIQIFYLHATKVYPNISQQHSDYKQTTDAYSYNDVYAYKDWGCWSYGNQSLLPRVQLIPPFRVIVELGAISRDIGLEVGYTRKCHYKSNHSSNIEIQTNHSHTDYNQCRVDN